MISAKERYDINPNCPHCKNPIAKTLYKAIEGFLGKRYFHFCPNYRCSLGVSHRKGFWMAQEPARRETPRTGLASIHFRP